MREMPAIASSTYASSAVNLAQAANFVANGGWIDHVAQDQWADNGLTGRATGMARYQNAVHSPTITQEKPKMAARRLVQVFIADPNENVPLEDSLLYSGDQKLTDATDQELFFEIDIKSLLDKHNEKRVKMIDKKVKERTEHLEPAKIRDLKMVVVTVAGF